MLWLDWTLEQFVRRDFARQEEEPRKESSAEVKVEPLVRANPRWMRLERAILAALAPFAEARLAVARALAELEPVPDGVT